MPNTQLLLQRELTGELPPIHIPAGYALRTYEGEADNAVWVHIMQNSLGSKYTLAGFISGIRDRPQFKPEMLFFLTHDGKPVGSSCAWRRDPSERRVGYVHMVGLLPEHRGKGLGRLLTLRTLHYFKEHGFTQAVLNTDDFRLAAIKSYLGLGFRPVMADEDHPARWLAIFRQLSGQAQA